MDNEPVLAENPAKMKRLQSNAEKTKEAEVSAHESLEAKEALFARASDEIQVDIGVWIRVFVRLNCAY